MGRLHKADIVLMDPKFVPNDIGWYDNPYRRAVA
jgi:hypothetical protein